MSSFLLDTSALLAHFRGENGSDRVQAILDDDTVSVHISALSVAEFARRLMSLGTDAAYARDCAMEYAGLATNVVPVDTAVSVRAFEIGSSCEVRLPLIDAFIAASSSLIGAKLIHRDGHFDRIPEGLVDQEELR
jgi:predicted nucleic acid-binding protein